MTKSDSAKSYLFQGGLFGGKGGVSNQVVKSPSSVPHNSVLQVKWCSKTSDPQKKNIPMTRNCHHFALFEPLQKVSNICSIFYRKAQTNWSALQWSAWSAPTSVHSNKSVHYALPSQQCIGCYQVQRVLIILSAPLHNSLLLCVRVQFTPSCTNLCISNCTKTPSLLTCAVHCAICLMSTLCFIGDLCTLCSA